MEDKQNNSVYVAIIIVAVIAFIFGYNATQYEDMTAEEWASEYNSLEYELEECQENLEAVEDAMSRTRGNIEDAKSYAWESYEDMGYALENLEASDY